MYLASSLCVPFGGMTFVPDFVRDLVSNVSEASSFSIIEHVKVISVCEAWTVVYFLRLYTQNISQSEDNLYENEIVESPPVSSWVKWLHYLPSSRPSEQKPTVYLPLFFPHECLQVCFHSSGLQKTSGLSRCGCSYMEPVQSLCLELWNPLPSTSSFLISERLFHGDISCCCCCCSNSFHFFLRKAMDLS